jgi:hypothetical protein
VQLGCNPKAMRRFGWPFTRAAAPWARLYTEKYHMGEAVLRPHISAKISAKKSRISIDKEA